MRKIHAQSPTGPGDCCPVLKLHAEVRDRRPRPLSLGPTLSEGETESPSRTAPAPSYKQPGPEPRLPDSQSALVMTQSTSPPVLLSRALRFFGGTFWGSFDAALVAGFHPSPLGGVFRTPSWAKSAPDNAREPPPIHPAPSSRSRAAGGCVWGPASRGVAGEEGGSLATGPAQLSLTHARPMASLGG